MGNNGSLPKDANMGFLVTQVQSGSPGDEAGMVADADFVLSVEGNYLRNMSTEEIQEFVKLHENKETSVVVYSRVECGVREVKLTPSSDWPGNGLLGISVALRKFDQPSRQGRASGEFEWMQIYGGEELGEESAKQQQQRRETKDGTPLAVKQLLLEGSAAEKEASTGSAKRLGGLGLVRSKTTTGVTLRTLGGRANSTAADSKDRSSIHKFMDFDDANSPSGVALPGLSDGTLRRSISFGSASPLRQANRGNKLDLTNVDDADADNRNGSSAGTTDPAPDSGSKDEGPVKKTRMYRMTRTLSRSVGLLPPKVKPKHNNFSQNAQQDADSTGAGNSSSSSSSSSNSNNSNTATNNGNATTPTAAVDGGARPSSVRSDVDITDTISPQQPAHSAAAVADATQPTLPIKASDTVKAPSKVGAPAESTDAAAASATATGEEAEDVSLDDGELAF